MIAPGPLPAGIRRAGRVDVPRMARILADAFSADPFNLWLIGRPRLIETAFRILIDEFYADRGQLFLAEDGGAAVWIDGEARSDFGLRAQLRWTLAMLMAGRPQAISRGAAAGTMMERAHPTQPHLYLFLIGTTQSARGSGLGKALMAPMLAACDRDGLPCYLESSDPANLGFYRAHGFDVTGELRASETAPPLIPMWRVPR